ncbi:TIGR04222 domain-containing membrane protein [Geodermatophilus sp. SYSU D00814]
MSSGPRARTTAMTGTRSLDVYETAYLTGGPRRAVAAAVVSLVETGVLRAARSTGESMLVHRRPCADLEAAVLDAVGIRGNASFGTVCWRLRDDVRLTSIGQRLRDDGLLARDRGPEPMRLRFWSALSLTGAGRRTLRQLRREPASIATDSVRVSLWGPEAMRDSALRVALFEASRVPSAPVPRQTASASAGHRYSATGHEGGGGGGYAGGFGDGGGDCGGGGGDGGGC